MTKVLILSDSHGLTDEITQITERHQLVYMIHCGDSELDMDAPKLEDFIKVAGNCDSDTRFPDEQTIQIEDLTCYVTHGHLQHVKMNLINLSYRAEEANAHVVCYGHTHIAGAEQIGKQLFINPGSIRLPNNRKEKTYAIMEWSSLEHVEVNFYTTTGELVKDLSYKATLGK